MRRKLSLVFPPFANPCSPPLGVAHLKNHVETHVPGWSVKALDLNLAYHEALYEAFASENAAALEGNAVPDLSLSPEAVAFFHGQDGGALLRRGDLHARYTFEMDNFFSQNARMLIPRLATAFKGGASWPRIFRDFADRVVAESPDAVGISACYNEQFWFAMCLATAWVDPYRAQGGPSAESRAVPASALWPPGSRAGRARPSKRSLGRAPYPGPDA